MNPGSQPTQQTTPGSTRVSALTRRRFLGYSGVAAAGALAVGATQVNWADLVQAAGATPLDPQHGVLVTVTLYGGNDGLNTVVPAADPTYQSARADLAYQPSEVLDLGDGLGLNPGLKGLKSLWDSEELAIVRGVGYPQADRSHFRSMAIWQTASPNAAVPTGWLGRWMDATTTDPLQALAIDDVLPPMLAGQKIAAAAFPVSGLRLPPNPLGAALAKLGRSDASDGALQALAARSIAELQTASRVLGAAAGTGSGGGKGGHGGKGGKGHPGPPVVSPTTTPETDSQDPNGSQGASAGGGGELAAQLGVVASLIEMGVPTRAYSVSLGGFDTHADERGTQQRLLTELDAALSGFQKRLQGTDRGKQVVTMVYSEFGRRVTANAGEGTDHGTAGPVFVLGRGVRGGFKGAEPSLTDLDAGDLKATSDFRSVYASMLTHVLGTDPGRVLDGYTRQTDQLFV